MKRNISLYQLNLQRKMKNLKEHADNPILNEEIRPIVYLCINKDQQILSVNISRSGRVPPYVLRNESLFEIKIFSFLNEDHAHNFYVKVRSYLRMKGVKNDTL